MENVLDKRFDELRDEGFIYSEPDEKGKDMSYGEYAAVREDLENTLIDAIKDRPFDQMVDRLKEVLDCGDDVRIFLDLDPYEDFVSNLSEEEINGEEYLKLYGDPDQYPEFLVNAYNEYREDVPEPYLDEEIDY